MKLSRKTLFYKIASLLLVLALAVLLPAMLISCGGDDNVDTTTTPNTSSDTKENGNGAGNDTNDSAKNNDEEFVFVYNGVTIAMHAPADPIIDALGEPSSTYDEPSCAFQGNDYYYNYGSFEVSAYEDGDERRIYSVYLIDDLVETPEGLSIGASESDVTSIYGDEGKLDNGSYRFIRGNSILNVIIENGTVTAIEYVAKVK